MTSGAEALSRTEAAERLGVAERTVDRYAAAGLLTARKNPVTRRVTFDPAEVDNLRAERDGA